MGLYLNMMRRARRSGEQGVGVYMGFPGRDCYMAFSSGLDWSKSVTISHRGDAL